MREKIREAASVYPDRDFGRKQNKYLHELMEKAERRKEELEAENPEHFAVRQYRKYKLAAGKTAKSILISCGARLAVFDIAELREVTAYDELELDTLGDRKTALFLIMSDTDDSFNFLISMCYTQLFNLHCEKADVLKSVN